MALMNSSSGSGNDAHQERPSRPIKRPATRSHNLEDPDQLRAIASPARQRLVAGLEALGLASVRELATHLGRSSESLYFHLHKLIACGLVVDVGERVVGRRTERLYRLVARRLRIAGDVSDPEFCDALAETCRSITRAAERDYCRALEHDGACLQGRGRNLALHHYHAHLGPQDRRRLVQMLEEVTSFVVEHNDPINGDLYSYTALLAAVHGKPSPQESTDA